MALRAEALVAKIGRPCDGIAARVPTTGDRSDTLGWRVVSKGYLQTLSRAALRADGHMAKVVLGPQVDAFVAGGLFEVPIGGSGQTHLGNGLGGVLPSQSGCPHSLSCLRAHGMAHQRGRNVGAGFRHAVGPAAVPGFVVPAGLDPGERETWVRLGSHICEEGREGFLPTLADRDASPSVTAPSPVVWIEASVLHRPPRAVLGRRPAPRAVAVNGVEPSPLSPHFDPETAATLDRSVAKLVGAYGRLSTAGALAQPVGIIPTPPLFSWSQRGHC